MCGCAQRERERKREGSEVYIPKYDLYPPHVTYIPPKNVKIYIYISAEKKRMALFNASTNADFAAIKIPVFGRWQHARLVRLYRMAQALAVQQASWCVTMTMAFPECPAHTKSAHR